MKIVDEPAAEIEPQLRDRGIEVRREPYDPKSRSLVTDFFRFLREPDSGDTVTLFEDERGRVRYFTVERLDPQIAQLNDRIAELSRVDPKVLEPRFEELERRVAVVDELREKAGGVDGIARKLARIDALEERVAKVDQLETRVARVDELEAKVARVDALEAKVAKVDELDAQIRKLPALETQVTELNKLSTRVSRLERPG